MTTVRFIHRPRCWAVPVTAVCRPFSTVAAKGEEVEAFHLALAHDQIAACRAGAYGAGIGGAEAGGATCREIGDL
jgi:hypothetical protein